MATLPDDGDVLAHPHRPPYLSRLSEAQYKAVTSPPDEPLQILAGPGSGKTRVLVCRVAWLVLEQNLDPRDLVVVTFTNKAANEMRHRLNALIGQYRTSLLILGKCTEVRRKEMFMSLQVHFMLHALATFENMRVSLDSRIIFPFAMQTKAKKPLRLFLRTSNQLSSSTNCLRS